MEDVPEKLRRNVMMISTTILLTWSLNLTLKTSGTILGFVDISNITPIKIWLLLAVLLAYFFLRYIYSDQVKDDLKKFKSEYTVLKVKNASKKINRQVHRYFKTGTPPAWMPHLIPVDGQNDLFPISRPMFKLIYFWDKNCSAGRIGITYKITDKRGETFTSADKEAKYDFEFSRIERFKIEVLTILRASTISKGAVDFLTPISLAILSILICAYKILFLIIPVELINHLSHFAG